MDFYDTFEEYFVEYTTEQCQYVLDHIQNSDDISYDMTISPQVIESILLYLWKYHENFCMDLKDMKIITLLKRITAYAALTFLNKKMSIEVKILAARLIISICSAPSASAYGIFNSNIIQQLLSHLTKIISNELKVTNKQNKHAGTKKALETVNIQLEKQHMEGIRTSQRIAAHSNQNIDLDVNSDNEDCFDTEVDDFVEDNEEIKINKAPKEVLKFNQLSLLFRDILKHIHIFSQQSDEFLLNSTMDLLIGFVFLCAIDIKFTSLSTICQHIIVAYGTSSKYTLTTCYRGLLPILTMAARNPLLPDIFKIKKSCHKASINVLQALIAASIQSSVLSIEHENNIIAEDSVGMTTQFSNNNNNINDNTEIEHHQYLSPLKTIVSSLSFPMVCIVALLQRMTLASPDKIQIRQVLLNSFIDILTDLQALCVLNDSPVNVVQNISLGITHYMSFLSKLSKSSKTSYRAFTLDIAAQILNTHWIWNYHSSTCNKTCSSDTNLADCAPPAYELLSVLLARCKDNSPAVRTRAISAITELLSNLSETSDSMMISAMYDIAMGVDVGSSTSQQTSPKESLFDILRERVEDEKTHVRTKALQALSLAFSRSWNKHINNIQDDSLEPLEPVQILIMEDDLELFASKCQDRSLSVRKQAMISLTDLLTARPKDSLIQDIWLKAVLPMCFDAETTVSNKVAEIMHSLLFDNLVTWYNNLQHEGSSKNDARINLVWRLTERISSLGLFKLLQSVLSTMLKQSLLTSSSGNSSSSVSYVTMILKHACCYHLNQSNLTIQDNKNSFETSSLELDSMRSSDEIVRGAWILMESLVSLSNMNVLSPKQETMKFGDVIKATGSADFVVHCFRQKHSDKYKSNKEVIYYDEEDLRIFSVLEILCENLTATDRQYMKEKLMLYLENFQCECSITSSVIAVMLQLTKAYIQEELVLPHSLLVKSKPIKSLKEGVKEWAYQLLTSAHTILHAFAFQSLPDLDLKSTSVLLLTNVKRFLSNKSNNSMNTESEYLSNSDDFLSLVQTALFIIGEIAMLGFSMEEDHSKTLLASKNNEDMENNIQNKSMEFFRLSIKDALFDLVKVYMGNYLPVLEGVTSTIRVFPHKIRANAFITMGKLCMRDKILARNHVNIFLREVSSSASSNNNKERNQHTKHLVDLSALCNDATHLDSSILNEQQQQQQHSSAVRSNALLVLGDMCVRFTSLVDRHVDTMAQCLQDSNAIVRKNALILLTQLLLQDFLKWKGFLLYRFLLLTVDSDLEIAEFSRNILQKTLSLKYPELLCSHFTETIVILNSCIEHPIYHSIVRTSIYGLDHETIESSKQQQQQPQEDKNNNSLTLKSSDSNFISSLSKTQRFLIYEFMSENIDDETKIQICAKLVQDILSAVVDNTSLLTKTTDGNNNKKNHSNDDLNSFENVLEDTLNLLRSPFLKVGQKQSSDVEEDNDGTDAALQDDVDSSAKGVNAKAAFNQAKTKVLKKLSSQHLVSHTLPVVISLKHVLEAVKSPLQGTLMEFLVSLIKDHKIEVEEALQFDPSLKAEIEYDLKQFEKLKKEVQTSNINHINKISDLQAQNQVITHSSSFKSASSVDFLKPKSPYLDVQQLPSRSVVKPILRKSLGGIASRSRTPFDALKSPGMHLSDKMITSALRNSDHNSSDSNVTDDVNRLTYSHSYHTSSEEFHDNQEDEINFATQSLPSQVLFGNNEIIHRNNNNNNSSSSNSPILKQSRRRSWGVVVDSLIPEGNSISLDGDDDSLKAVHASDQLLSSVSSADHSSHSANLVNPPPPPQRYTPAKKIRYRKSRSPTIMKLGCIDDFLTQPILFNSENIIPISNNIELSTKTNTKNENHKLLVEPILVKQATTTTSTLLATIVLTNHSISSSTTIVQGTKRGSSQQTDSLLSLLK